MENDMGWMSSTPLGQKCKILIRKIVVKLSHGRPGRKLMFTLIVRKRRTEL
jgi:hypothetical protein